MSTTRRVLTIAAIIVLHGTFGERLYAACKTDACREAMAWKEGFTAIVLRPNLSAAQYAAALKAISASGGTVGIETNRVLLGWFRRGGLAALRNVKTIQSVATAPLAAVFSDTESEAALGFFNRVLSGEYEDHVETGLTIEGAPLVGCVANHDVQQARDVRVSATSSLGIEPTFWFRQPFQNPDMRGRVRVNYFKLESNGGIDPNLYSWSYGDSITADDQVFGAFTFWANQAALRGITLSFTVKQYVRGGLYRWQNWYEIPYEPITRPTTADHVWINSVLAPLGYAASPVTDEAVYTKSESFNAASQTVDASLPPFDRAFSVYLVYNPPPAATWFPNGENAYARFDGPHTTVLWDSAGWGPTNLGRVLAHETGHIFWACDEYYEPARNRGCLTCDWCLFNAGPRPNLPNGNCDYPAAGCLVPRVNCIMKSSSSTTLCPHTIPQIGW